MQVDIESDRNLLEGIDLFIQVKEMIIIYFILVSIGVLRLTCMQDKPNHMPESCEIVQSHAGAEKKKTNAQELKLAAHGNSGVYGKVPLLPPTLKCTQRHWTCSGIPLSWQLQKAVLEKRKLCTVKEIPESMCVKQKGVERPQLDQI